jgi:hypothetical protein
MPTAVAAGDYRLALNDALESREQAQNAARGAADAKARVRAEVDRAAAEITTLVMQGRIQLAAAERVRAPRRVLDEQASPSRQMKKQGRRSRPDYLGAHAALEGGKERVEAAIAAINDAMPARSPQRRR